MALLRSARSAPTPLLIPSVTVTPQIVVPTVGSLSEFSVQKFTTDAGLPGTGIQCMLHGQNGALWLGAEEGVIRFDGRQFKTIDVTIPRFRVTGSNVRAIAEDGFGTRWLGMFEGLVRQQGDEWHAFTNIGSARLIRRLAPARDGTLWLAGNRHPAPRGRAQLRRFDPATGRLVVDTLAPGQVRDLRLAPGGLWVATDAWVYI